MPRLRCLFVRGLLSLSLTALVLPWSSQAADELSVGGGVDVTQGFWLVAAEKGMAEKHGLNLTVKTFESGSLALEATAAGDVAASGTSGGLPTLRAKSKGADFAGVAAVLKAPLISCAVATADIKSAQDLEGQTVGFMIGSSSEFWWSRYSALHGVSNVSTKNLSPPETITAMSGGDIVAFFNWQPWCDRAQEIIEGAHVLAWGGDDNLQPFADAMITYNGKFLRERPDVALRLLRAVHEAVQWIPQHSREAAQIMAKRFRGDVDQFTRDIDNIEWGLRLDRELRELLYAEARWMSDKALIDVDDPEALVDSFLYSDFLRQIDPEAVD